jgi:hypothetical protein
VNFQTIGFKRPILVNLPALLAEDGLDDGTVQVDFGHGLFERHESLLGVVARFRMRLQRASLDISPGRLATLFTKSGRRLRPDVQRWFSDTLDPMSRPWRLRRYASSKGMRRARRYVDEFLEFDSDADLIAFKLRWSELWQ